ncbi:hypothetical protein G6O69_36365 [Pseudenhygromyxa sp. WMMC2535]|uniref:hypothetical protein n=1 Tax=Pseudenhygromyxa sp. WMMC2535 TaxID=2712867 RepID=UPI0015522954|nr:hypothetical protein [Pseudenhygromyxa sp. WMMC2535]NVB43357.1 hypothetical protein [Pseudenhygromyxa sp. WMMC2535]
MSSPDQSPALLRHWQRFWYTPIDPAPLALFRQAFAWTMLIYFLAWAVDAPEWLTAAGYHPPAALDPANSPQLPLLPEAALPWVGGLFFAALLAYIFGFARKLVIWPVWAGAVYVLMADPISAFTINRLFVIGLTILALAPEPEPEPEPEPATPETGVTEPQLRQRAWPTRMLQLTLIAQYFASGLCKTINGDWWTGEDVLWMQIQGIYMTDAAAWMVRVLPHWVWGVLEALALWFELLAPLLFGIRRLLPVAFCLGIGMHLMIAMTMDQLIYFSLQMCCFYLVFLPAPWARKLAI